MAARRLSYTTDLTDEEWQILKPLLPPEKAGGRPRKYPMREVINGIQYVLRAGCAWRLMPHDLPHWQTAYHAFRAWRQDGTWLRLHDQLRDEVRTCMGRHPQPSGAIIAVNPPFSVVLTVCASIMAAEGCGWRPMPVRTRSRS